MKYLLSFIAGIIVDRLVKPKPRPKKREYEVYYRDPLAHLYAHTYQNPYLTNAKQNKVTGYVNKDNKLLGVWDRALTNDEIKRVWSAGEDGIRASFEDTQPIRIDDE